MIAGIRRKARRRLIVLGAGAFQAPAIRKAAAMGCHVISVDNVPDNPGHAFAHESVHCSTVDRVAVAEICRRLQADGICTFASDVALPSVGLACDAGSLPGVSERVADVMTNKQRFREFQKKHNIPAPAFAAGDALSGIWARLQTLRYPVMFKPVDSSGSRGVSRLDFSERGAAEAAFQHAASFSRTATVCVEEWLPGTEVGGDGFMEAGRLVFAVVSEKHMRGYAVTGHRLPASLSASAQAAVKQEVERCCRELGYRDGPVNFDVIVGADVPWVLELSARTGGNGIPAIIGRATGVDLEEQAIRFALGERLEWADGGAAQACGSFVFGSERDGILRQVRDRDALRQEVPEVFELFLARRPGDRVLPFTHNGNLIGCALFDCRDAQRYAACARRILDALTVCVTGDA
jgi:biotin carboxylase